MRYATHEEALDNVELGVTGTTSYGNFKGDALDFMKRNSEVFELCEWTDRVTGEEVCCWVLHWTPESTWEFINEGDAAEAGLTWG